MDYTSEIQTEWDIRMSDYWCLFGITLLYWDHILTFPAEVKYIWRRPRGASGYIFFLNRYFTALTNIVVIVSRLGPKALLESSSCPAFQKVRDGIVAVAQIIVLCIMTMRIYALYACSKRVLWSLLCILTTGTAVCVFALSYRPGQPEFNARRCHTPRDKRQAIQVAATYEAVFAYDILIFLLAMYKAYQVRKESQISIPLRNIIIRDGTLYFGAVSLVSLGNILTVYFAGPFMRSSVTPVASSLSVTLLSRLMLHLHESADTNVHYLPTEIETRIQYHQADVCSGDADFR